MEYKLIASDLDETLLNIRSRLRLGDLLDSKSGEGTWCKVCTSNRKRLYADLA